MFIYFFLIYYVWGLFMERFLSQEPEVNLVNAFDKPFISIIDAALTCYSGKGVVQSKESKSWFKNLAQDLYKAGHHTTFQHAQFQFSLENISRQSIWSFFHSHMFYNSEQVSQRYVPMKRDSYAVPPLKNQALELYNEIISMQMDAYNELKKMLFPAASSEYYRIFPGRIKKNKEYDKEVKKRVQEIARYVLPVATFAYMVHTVSGITLLRYKRLAEQFDVPLEQKLIVDKMVEEVLKFDPEYKNVVEIEDMLPLEETPEYKFLEEFYKDNIKPSELFFDEFDSSLEGKISKLIGYKGNNEQLLAGAVREVLGLSENEMTNSDAIDRVLNPARNNLYGEALNLTTHSKLTRALYHSSYTFRKKISHTADSQDQRHRMTPGSRPILITHLRDEPDFITPELIRQDDGVLSYYKEIMDKTWEGILKLRKLGIEDQFVIYLLPNAFPIRFTESSDLLNLHHKHSMRLCYNAQEEIWRASLDEALQVEEINSRIGKYLIPPCNQRLESGTTPICPEGERFCGVNVWNLNRGEYKRLI